MDLDRLTALLDALGGRWDQVLTVFGGAALAAGIMLSPLFRGTGYAPEQRTQGDFGSDVYLIEESDGE